MAARFAYQHPELVEGLVLWASYPAANNDLSARDIHVTSIYSTQDGLATVEEIDASRALLPAETRWVAIQGGNHAQFGLYGDQRGDRTATIDRTQQQQQVIEATLQLMQTLD
jgi:dienelactone hydrolase